MNERAEQAKSIFLEAIDKHSPAQWPAYVDKVCAGDAELRGDVEKLLHAQAELGSFHEEPRLPVVPTIAQAGREGPGTVIGAYKLLEQIGEGGFGVVFMAEQSQPVRRRVALKILKPGMDTRQVVARFEAERQALAIMDHPNIAKVFDGGSTESSSPAAAQQPGCFGSGRPYFVMELVKGIPITDFCDQNHLTPRKRLELFVAVCQAVQHAHHKGIIHRDLKPSNVLVTVHDTTPVPKVIDFGIAKALGQDLTDKTLFTGFAQMIGTPLYMSPEQAGQSGLDIDTRSDIYSLGALLYELLTGTTPLDKERFKQAAYDEIRRIIREEEPPRPSTRLSESKHALPSISAQRQTEPAKLTRLVRGELDWIVMKALDKDRNRRYETANDFAMDVQRYLADDPVEACPPSPLYRMRKFGRRHKVGLVMAAVVVASLALVVSSLSWMVREQTAKAHEQAQREAETTRAVNALLDESLEFQKARNVPRALARVKEAAAILPNGAPTADLKERVQTRLTDLTIVTDLEEIRTRRALPELAGEGQTQMDKALQDYARVFKAIGIDLWNPVPDETAKQIRERTVAVELAEALDDLASLDDGPHIWGFSRGLSKTLREVAGAADPDPWRNKVRKALEPTSVKIGFGPSIVNAKALRSLLVGIKGGDLLPSTAVVLVKALTQTSFFGPKAPQVRQHYDEGVQLLLEAQATHAHDFWLNWELANLLFQRNKPGDREASLQFLTSAVSLRPAEPNARLLLGVRCLGTQDDRAILALQEAIRLQPNYPSAHGRLGTALHNKGRLEDALVAFRKAVELGATDTELVKEYVDVLTKKKLDQEAAAVLEHYNKARAPKDKSPQIQRTSDSSGFDAEVAAAWQMAGARLGWGPENQELSLLHPAIRPHSWWHRNRFLLYDYAELPALPCIQLLEWPQGGIQDLPAPTAPFGLFIERLPSTPGQLKHLGKLHNLQMLSFGAGASYFGPVGPSMILTDAVLKEMGSLAQLQTLQLCCAIPETGLGHLGGLEKLHTLSLRQPRVDQRPFAPKRLDSQPVRELNLEALARLPVLQTLNLGDMNLRDAGLEHVAKLKHLKMLVLQGNTKVTDAGLTRIAALRHLQTLDLRDTSVRGAGLKELVGLKQLKSLQLGANVTNDAMTHVAKMHQLQDLTLGRQITNQGLHELRELTNLRLLDLTATKVTDKGLKELVHFPELHTLRLSNVAGNPQATDAGLKELVDLRQLKTLRIYLSAEVTDDGLSELAKLKHLQVLVLHGVFRVSDAGLKHLGKLSELQALALKDAHVTDDGLTALAGLTKLQRLDLKSKNITDQGLKHLEGLQELRMLLVESKVTEDAKAALRKRLPKLETQY